MSKTIQIRPIHNEEDFAAAMIRVGEILHAEPGTKERDERDILFDLIDKWQLGNHDVPVPTPVEAVKYAMERESLKVADMSIYFGDQSRVSEFLAGKRSLNVEQIRRLAEDFSIPLGVLLGKAEERWRVPRNREQYVFRVTVLSETVQDARIQVALEGYFSRKGRRPVWAFEGDPNFEVLAKSAVVYGPPEMPGRFYPCDIENGVPVVVGYTRRL